MLVASFSSGQKKTGVAEDSGGDEVIRLAPAEESTFLQGSTTTLGEVVDE